MLWLARAEGSLGKAAAFHLRTGGHFLRARLALAACAALRVDRKQAIYLAAACEFLHNASLVHDDIQDNDLMRRDQPSVWHLYGISIAITLGDFLFGLGFLAISKINCPAKHKADLLELFSHRSTAVIRGQGRDLDVSGDLTFALSDYDALARAKTGPLLSIAIEGALLLSGADAALCAEACTCMEWFGIAYQLRDDLLDFCVQEERDAAASDLRNAKANAVLLRFVAASPPEERNALSILMTTAQQSAGSELLQTWARRIRTSSAFEMTIHHFFFSCKQSSIAAEKLPAELANVIRAFVTLASDKIENLRMSDCASMRAGYAR
jgi:geranylgeranyl pyrophosphate synthase